MKNTQDRDSFEGGPQEIEVPRLKFISCLMMKRFLSLPVRHLNSSGAIKTVPASQIAKTSVISTTLYLEPSKWRGLPAEKIFQLFRERTVKLGAQYKPCQEELDALLSTSEETGVLKRDIKKIYYGGEKAAADIVGSSLADEYNPLTFKFDELPSQAQDLVAQHREQRFYNRLAAYELPLLAQYRQPYKRADPESHPLEYRFTTYLGEEHPNARKVSLQVKTTELALNNKERHKFQVLARTRYDSETDIFKMSSDKFPEAAQNTRYLNDVFQKLLKEAKDMTDDFSDISLDKRHTIAKNLRKKKHHYEFPEEWKRPEDAPREKINVIEELSKTYQV